MEKLKGIVNATTAPKEWNGQIQVGFTLKDDPNKWYNISGEEEELKKIKETLLKKGNEIEFNLDDEGTGKITDLKVIAAAKNGGWEEDIVNFEALLKAAHDKKVPFSIKTKMIEINLEKKYALFKAMVIQEQIGKIPQLFFQGHGDSTAENVKGEHIKPHFIRMAETRAICRALRWYTNNAACSEEEKSNSNKEEK